MVVIGFLGCCSVAAGPLSGLLLLCCRTACRVAGLCRLGCARSRQFLRLYDSSVRVACRVPGFLGFRGAGLLACWVVCDARSHANVQLERLIHVLPSLTAGLPR